VDVRDRRAAATQTCTAHGMQLGDFNGDRAKLPTLGLLILLIAALAVSYKSNTQFHNTDGMISETLMNGF
jgi:hypothetical protein